MTEPLAPGLGRRFGAFAYEGVLLFGITLLTGLVYAPLVGQRSGIEHRTGLITVLAIVYGVYFVFFWTRGRRTLPMQTWHLLIQRRDGQPLGLWQALLRYIFSWLWFMPALICIHLTNPRTVAPYFVGLAAGVLAYVLVARLHPSRQFLHDLLAGTRMVTYKSGKQQ